MAAAALALVVLAPSPAQAQPAVCRQIEAELASLDRPVMRAGRIANAERAQLTRINGNMAAMNCNRGFVLFGPPLPPQCTTLRSQAAALQGRIADIETPRQVASAGDPGRRRQLLAALDSYNCRRQQVATVQPRPRSFLEALFGVPEQPQYATPPGSVGNLPPLVDGVPVDQLPQSAQRRGGGGNLPICVRTCDGFFFPVNYEGTGANDQYDEMCQASCPAAPTELYWMPAGGDLDQAANQSGQNYTALPNAFKYRQSYDPACSCKGRDQTWATALKHADTLLASRRNDITVTRETSDEMALGVQPLRGTRSARDRKPGQPDIVTGAARQPQASAAEPGTDMAGARGRSGRAASDADPEPRESASGDADRRRVRVVAPPPPTGR